MRLITNAFFVHQVGDAAAHELVSVLVFSRLRHTISLLYVDLEEAGGEVLALRYPEDTVVFAVKGDSVLIGNGVRATGREVVSYYGDWFQIELGHRYECGAVGPWNVAYLVIDVGTAGSRGVGRGSKGVATPFEELVRYRVCQVDVDQNISDPRVRFFCQC